MIGIEWNEFLNRAHQLKSMLGSDAAAAVVGQVKTLQVYQGEQNSECMLSFQKSLQRTNRSTVWQQQKPWSSLFIYLSSEFFWLSSQAKRFYSNQLKS